MKKSSTLGRLIAATVQSAIVPMLGIVFYYILSGVFSTAGFGIISWGNAVSMWLIMAISYGLEQISLRRLAAGNATSTWVAVAFFVHTFAGTALAFGTLLVLRAVAGTSMHEGLALLPLLFLAQGANLLVVPLKTLLNARERFLPYAVVSLLSNVARIGALLWLMHSGHEIKLPDAALLLLVPSVAEVIAMLFFVWHKVQPITLRIPRRGYLGLLREATPQALTVLFDIRLGGRADWILMGILSTNAATGLYTFAARGCELLRMPVSVISMLLMPRLARMLQHGLSDTERADVQRIYRLEMGISCALIVGMNTLWGPVISMVTHGKYGYTNAVETGILSLGTPFHFAQNLFWMVAFSAKRYNAIARITIIASICNMAANAALIPLLSGAGAALAYLGASVLQALLLASELQKDIVAIDNRPLLASLGAAIVCFAGVVLLPIHFLAQFGLGLAAYFALTFLLRQWRRDDWAFTRRILSGN